MGNCLRDGLMSWYSLHPLKSKTDGRQIAGYKACRECVHYARVYAVPRRDCARCGNPREARLASHLPLPRSSYVIKAYWYCRQCESSGVVSYDKKISMESMVARFIHAHRQASPGCTAKMANLRISKEPFIND